MTSTQTTPRTRASRMAPEDRRAEIVTATLPLLEEHGGDVTTRQIAQAAGIAEGTIFRVFPDKAALFRAVLERVVDPDAAQAALVHALRDETTLPGRVEAAATHLATRSRRVMQVMMALRATMAPAQPVAESVARLTVKAGPPEFMQQAQERLQADLAALVFEPYRHELRVSPTRAALVLRSLVLGVHHPGALRGEDSLSALEIADVVLNGVAR